LGRIVYATSSEQLTRWLAEWGATSPPVAPLPITVVAPRVEVDSTGRLLAAFAVLKPFQLISAGSAFPLGLVARWDRFKPNTESDAYINTIIGGLTWDLNRKTALSLDYQEQTPHSGASAASTKTYFLHLVANF
jgi:hypothetical protein